MNLFDHELFSICLGQIGIAAFSMPQQMDDLIFPTADRQN